MWSARGVVAPEDARSIRVPLINVEGRDPARDRQRHASPARVINAGSSG